jgi:hypothetical protein
MAHILILLASLFVVGESFALPPCPATGVFDNCYTEKEGEVYPLKGLEELSQKEIDDLIQQCLDL